MAITLDKTITRNSGNIINTDTNYSELNVKANGLVEDIVDHIETELTSAETQVNTQLTTLDNTITETLDSKNLTLQYKNDAQASAEQSASSASSASQIVLGQSTGRANIKPVLNLDFVNQKRLDSKVDFTRTSTATYYDGKKMAKAEENLLKESDDLSTFTLVGNGVVEHNSIIAPDGTLTASKITATDKTTHIWKPLGFSADIGYTRSIYAKVPTGTAKVTLTAHNSNGVVTLTDQWQRFTLTDVVTTLSANFYPVDFRNGNTTATEVHIWHPQLEQRDFATAYTPTLDKPITNYIPVLSTAQANEPRFDYDLETKECKGLLIEEQRTNLIPYSEDLLAYGSFLNATAISNVAISPFGTLTANKLIADTSNDKHVWYKTLTTELTSYTYSVFAKKAEKSILIMSAYWGGASAGFGINFDLENEETSFNSAIATSVTSNVTSKIENFGNGWYRCSCSWTNVDANKLVNSLTIGMSDISDYVYNPNWKTSQYIGNNFDGIYVFGLQLEQGSFATSYIPTNGSQVTRTKDYALIQGDNFSDIYNVEDGTVYFNGNTISKNVAYKDFLAIENPSTQNRMCIRAGSTEDSVYNEIKNNGVVYFGYNTTISSGTFFKTAISWSNEKVSSFTSDAPYIGTDTDFILSKPDRLILFPSLCGYAKKISLYPKQISDTELQLMTQG